MRNVLENLRSRSREERRAIALSTAGFIVFIIIIIWATSLLGAFQTVGSAPLPEPQEQKASAFDSLKRKAGLLFNNDKESWTADLFVKPVEYKQEDVSATNSAQERDLNELLQEFYASSSAHTSTTEEE